MHACTFYLFNFLLLSSSLFFCAYGFPSLQYIRIRLSLFILAGACVSMTSSMWSSPWMSSSLANGSLDSLACRHWSNIYDRHRAMHVRQEDAPRRLLVPWSAWHTEPVSHRSLPSGRRRLHHEWHVGPASRKFCSLVFSASASWFKTATNLSVIVGVRSQAWILRPWLYICVAP